MMLTLLFYASFSWNKNITEELNLALFPIDPQEGPPSRHRSKQGLIDEIHKTLMWKYRDRLIRPPTPVLIGENVIRVHVNAYHVFPNQDWCRWTYQPIAIFPHERFMYFVNEALLASMPGGRTLLRVDGE